MKEKMTSSCLITLVRVRFCVRDQPSHRPAERSINILKRKKRGKEKGNGMRQNLSGKCVGMIGVDNDEDDAKDPHEEEGEEEEEKRRKSNLRGLKCKGKNGGGCMYRRLKGGTFILPAFHMMLCMMYVCMHAGGFPLHGS